MQGKSNTFSDEIEVNDHQQTCLKGLRQQENDTDQKLRSAEIRRS